MARYYDRILKERITRRRLLATGAAMGAAGATLAACGGGTGNGTNGEPTSAPEAEGTPRPGGILRQRQTSAYPNFNPFGPGIAALTQGLFTGFTIFDHLWYVPTDTGETVLFLADEIEIIDELTIRAHMKDAVFHDKPPVSGRDVRSTDLKASVERFREQVPFGFSWLQAIFERMDTPDDRTVIYHQNRPWFWFFTSSNAGSPWTSSIIPEEIVHDDDQLNDDPIGSGRWILDGHDAGTNVRLRKFPNWREPGLPYLDGIDYVFIPDDTAADAAFRAGDIDTLGGLNNEEADGLKSAFGDDVIISSDLSRSYRTLMMTFQEPFLDEGFRKAINLALNREEIIQLIDLGDGVPAGPLPPAHEAFLLPEDDPDMQEFFRHDPQEARQMIEQSGFDTSRAIELKYHTLPGNPDLAQIIAEQLRDVGLNITLTGEDITAWLSNTLGPGNFEMTCFTHLAYEDPSLPLSFYVTLEGANFMKYEDPEVEAAFFAAAEEEDFNRRVELTQECQRVIIRKNAPQYTLYAPISYSARRSYYKGVVEGRGSFGLFNSRSWLDK